MCRTVPRIEKQKKIQPEMANEQIRILIRNRGQIRENRQGKDFGGLKGYLEDIWGNPSRANPAKNPETLAKKNKHLRKTEKCKDFSLFCLSFSLIFENG